MPDQLVLVVTQAEHLAPLAHACLDAGQIGGRQVEVGAAPLGDGERHRRLAEHRRDNGGVDHHPEREATAETHPEGADTRPAALGVELARPEPRNQAMIGEVSCSAHVVNSRAMHTWVMLRNVYPAVGSRPGVPTSEGITTRKPAATTSSANSGHLGRDAGDLVDHHDSRARALRVRGAGDASVGEGPDVPTVADTLVMPAS